MFCFNNVCFRDMVICEIQEDRDSESTPLEVTKFLVVLVRNGKCNVGGECFTFDTVSLTTTFPYSCCPVLTHKSCQVLFVSELQSSVIRHQGIWTDTSQNCVVGCVCVHTTWRNSGQTHTGTDSDHHAGLVLSCTWPF
jgi:hypothetical protein